MRKTTKLLTIGITAIVFVWTLAMMPAPSSAATLNVPEDYETIQAAIDAASDGDTVLVASGDYYESITMRTTPGVTLQGAGADKTTIAAILNYAIFCDVSDCKIDGFTIKGGQYGIWNRPSSPTITNNIITGNTYYGIYNDTYDSVSSSPTITDNTITGNNYCGIYNKAGSSPTITNNIITGNGWGTVNYGGIHNEPGSSPTITNNIITGNNPYGIYNYASWPTITNNIITNNGKGIQNWAASPEITNNTITGNIDSGIYNEVGSSPTITNNIITGGDCGIYNDFYSSPAITYNDLFVPDGTDICNDETSNPTVEYNKYEDPMFENPDEADYHLQASSPCIDAGWNDAPGLPETDFEGNNRIINDIVDMGAFEYQGTGEKPMNMECFEVNYMKVIDKKKHGAKRYKIKIRGSFKLADEAEPFDPEYDVVTVTINYDNVSEVITIPAASFKQKHSLWRFKGDIPDVGRVHMHLNFDKCRWWIKIRGKDTSELVGSERATVKLNIGMNTGEYSFDESTKKRDRHRIGFAKFIKRPRIRCCR